MDYKNNQIKEIAGIFEIPMKALRPEFIISGSPERSDFRCVIESDKEELFLIEGFEGSKASTKRIIAETINSLHKKGLTKTIPYIKSQEGSFLVNFNGLTWQTSRFIDSEPLLRPDYVMIDEIGTEFGRFLRDLKMVSNNINWNQNENSIFSIKKYIIRTLGQIEKFNPEIIGRIKQVYSFLSDSFFCGHDKLKTGFCHGDIHPMNAIWKGNKIIAVIDWEFMGIKPEIYDLANLLGCIGIEDPNVLGGGLVKKLIGMLKKSDIYDKASWDVLVEFVIAVRFGWLSEWLRKKDHEMIELETDFMNLLVRYSHDITTHWNSIKGES